MLPKDLLRDLERADDVEKRVNELVTKQWKEEDTRRRQIVSNMLALSAVVSVVGNNYLASVSDSGFWRGV